MAKSRSRNAAARKKSPWAALRPGPQNYTPLSPITFLPRAAEIYPDRVAVIHGGTRFTYAQFYERSRRLAAALAARGVKRGDVVSAMLPNTPPMLEAHYGVPALGAVLNTINTRLDADTVAFILEHSGAKVLLADRVFSAVIGAALAKLKKKPFVIDVDDPLYTGPGARQGAVEYEAFLRSGDARFQFALPRSESDPISLNYTSGTTGRPKGVVYHHRGTYLESVGNVLAWGMPAHPVYLWTVPLFHCNGWCFGWSVTAMGGTHVCLRAVDPAVIYPMLVEHGVTHMCGAPTVLTMLASAPEEHKRRFPQTVHVMTGGSPPPAKVIKAMEELGFQVLHIYGMTELQGPSTFCAPQEAWTKLPLEERANEMARQGVRYQVVEEQIVADPKSCRPVPQDGRTIGEILIRGNTVMLGYLKDAKATKEAFHGDWMHTGDLAVWHPSNYVEIKDRKKDIIISGGENISSVEVEIALYKHPATALAAVVARPDDKWGETPCAFVQLKPGASVSESDLIAHCRANLARFKVPRKVVFGELPTTATGKIQKYTLRERAKSL
ncbi:MAG: acyl-CoA synthetase [Betaproteobacteria bacterium RIFCSPLOWO2_02_67_12]|nr:MAG: acyl-CoA synthetase [Betaproteobacteria bacterium RIFCSPLOWO2_02_67_12]